MITVKLLKAQAATAPSKPTSLTATAGNRITPSASG